MQSDNTVVIKIRLGGCFVPKSIGKNRHIICWNGGVVFSKKKASISKMSVHFIREAVVHGFMFYNMKVPRNFHVFYKQKGRTFTTGKREIVNVEEVKGLLETVNKEGVLEVFVPSKQIVNPLNDHTSLSTLEPTPRLNEGVSTLEITPKFKTVARKDSAKGKGNLQAEGPGEGIAEVKGKSRAIKKLFDDEENGCGSSSSSEFSDLGIEWEAGEEEGYEDGEEWFRQTTGEILSDINGSFGEDEESDEDGRVVKDPRVQINDNIDCNEVRIQEEIEGDSDELRSLAGDSDEDLDNSPWFNGETDFTKPIKLVEKLKFNNVYVLRKALRVHAIEHRYEFYFLHNDGTRITTRCKKRCGCLYNKKRSRLPKCSCEEGVKCFFKIHATKLVKQETWQIKSLILKHLCMRSMVNNNVTSEYIAERYLEEFRSGAFFRVKQLQERVSNELGIKVGYTKAWIARCIAKLIIYGSASEQYARVWDYGKAVMQNSKGSDVHIVVNGIEQPEPPLFLRMFIGLAPLKDGFVRGCRPIIGVDGCHLKGAYPGQILVAVSKDGNNNIFPLAWATVEIENTETWEWFLECVKSMLRSD
ncbi:uncharacterized protein [Spinacia oleracea]|uniref:Transposase MuDR plant domain-containing protein n=1 Tax=Spinacia oleracea TaxID=3562 RepID=A0ABM3RJN8_SPIOL|nr:uncharacterized protein LOC130470214 [Spinacia oleracea]